MGDKNHWRISERTACGLRASRVEFGCQDREMFLGLNPAVTCARCLMLASKPEPPKKKQPQP